MLHWAWCVSHKHSNMHHLRFLSENNKFGQFVTSRPLWLHNDYITLKVLNFWKFTSYCSLKPLWSGMREVVPARTSLTLHPPSPPTMHQLSWLALQELRMTSMQNDKVFLSFKLMNDLMSVVVIFTLYFGIKHTYNLLGHWWLMGTTFTFVNLFTSESYLKHRLPPEKSQHGPMTRPTLVIKWTHYHWTTVVVFMINYY